MGKMLNKVRGPVMISGYCVMAFLFLTNSACFAQEKPLQTEHSQHCHPAVLLTRANGPRVVYPSDLQQKRIQGEVVVNCDIMENGQTDHCQVVSSSGEKAFEVSALNYVRELVYQSATCNDKPVIEHRHSYKIKFSQED